jgi:hypothetical protein
MMQDDPTVTTQEQLLQELLAHEHGAIFSEPADRTTRVPDDDEELGSLPYAYALEAIVT